MAKDFDEFIALINDEGLSDEQQEKLEGLIRACLKEDGSCDLVALMAAVNKTAVQTMLFYLRRYHEWADSQAS